MRRLVALALVSFALVGCGRPFQPARPLQEPPPASPGVERSVGQFHSADGVTLFEQCWRPESAEPRSVVVVVHGIKDHSSRYHAFAERMVRRGHAVCGFDHRGHGRSSGRRFAIASFDAVVGDIAKYLDIVRARYGDPPVFMFGHSMGGLLISLALAEDRIAPAGAIVSSAALRPHIHPFEIASLGFIARLVPDAPLLPAPNDTLSNDPEGVADLGRDPLVYQGKGTGEMALELIGAIRRVWNRADQLEAPLLLLHGIADASIHPWGTAELHRRAASADKTLHLYRDAGHDLLRDPLRDRVIADIERWLDRRAPPVR